MRSIGHSSDEFETLYAGKPAWDIGRPQPAFLALARAGQINGRVLDVGCGTGEHALMAAELGLDTTGIDTSARAIEAAKAKARERGLPVDFRVADALQLGALGQSFDTVLDSGLFHVFDEARAAAFVDSLQAVTVAGSRYFLLCFSDRQPGSVGPRRLTEHDIRTAFSRGWRIDSLERATMDITIDPRGAQAWLASMTRLRA